MNYNISASQSVDAGVIFAGVGYTHTDSVSTQVKTKVPAYKYGEAGVKNAYAMAHGAVSWPSADWLAGQCLGGVRYCGSSPLGGMHSAGSVGVAFRPCD